VFTCPFHSWSFDEQGRLRGVPDADRFLKLVKAERSLTPVSVECWKGFIFMNPQQNPDTGLQEYLGTLANDLAGYPSENLEVAGHWSVTLDCNWKVLVDAFQEGYHVMSIHKNTQPANFKASRSGQNRLVNFRTHGAHRSVTVGKNPDPVSKPIEALARELVIGGFSRGIEAGQSGWRGLNPGGHPHSAFAFDINIIFPSTFIDITQGFAFSYEIYPISERRTRFEITYLTPKPENWAEMLGMEFFKVQLRESLMEDLTTMESVQRGLESGAIKTIILSDQEIAIRHNYREVERAVCTASAGTGRDL
jgi:phenylpropionate dioxygenase-like ring-hydroxylating dioxygenase large terminal subunit